MENAGRSQIEQTVKNEGTIEGDVYVAVHLPQERHDPPPQTLFAIRAERNAYFTGREDELTAIHTALQSGQNTAVTQAITGSGGVGKTQIAIEYAYRHRADYRYILWVGAEGEEGLYSGYREYAQRLKVPGANAQEAEQVRDAFRSWLAENEGWLLIFDNVEDVATLKPFLPVGHRGRILLTSRLRQLEGLSHCKVVKILIWPLPEATEYLLKRRAPNGCTQEEHRAAAQLAEELGGLPLALEQAAAYMVQEEDSFQYYLSDYRRLRLELLDRRGPALGDYAETVLTTWNKSFEKVRAKSPACVEILRLSAFLAPDNIPYEIFLDGGASLGEPLCSVLSNPLEKARTFNELLTSLADYSLIQRDRPHSVFSLHRLLQEVLKVDESIVQRDYAERILTALSAATPVEIAFSNWLLCERLLAHQQSCWEAMQAYGIATVTCASLLNQTATYLQSQGRYTEAEPLYLRALDIREKQLGAEHPGTGTTLNHLAGLYTRQQRYAEAEPLYLRALDIAEKQLGAEHPDTAISLNNLAALYYSQERYAEAEPLYLRALDIAEKQLGAEHPDTAGCLSNLALLYYSQERYAEAEPFLLRALDISEKQLGAEHPDNATTLNNLAELYKRQGRYAEAEPLYLRALHILEQSLPPSHPHIEMIFKNIAFMYQAMGEQKKAQAF